MDVDDSEQPAVATPVIPPPPAFDSRRAVLFALAVGAPALIALVIDHRLALFAGLGGFLVMMVDPRRSVVIRAEAIVIAIALVFGAAVLGTLLKGARPALFAVSVALAFVAGLPPPQLPYLGLVAKFVVAGFLVGGLALLPTAQAVAPFVAGAMAALALSIGDSLARGGKLRGNDPRGEWRAIRSGSTNDVTFALGMAAGAALALIVAQWLGAAQPAWVVVTVIFVLHPDYSLAYRRIRARLLGTLVGVAIAGAAAYGVPTPLPLAVLALLAAASIPWGLARSVFAGTAAVTATVMLLLALFVLDTTKDLSLLAIRLYDTVLGCIVVAIVRTALTEILRLRMRIARATSANLPP